jgi:hypothetical protein
MWYRQTSREELVDLIERDSGNPIASREGRNFSDIRLGTSGIAAYWKDEPSKSSSLPTGVVVRSEDLEDFIAWVATYVPLRPFTAFCRVVDPTVIDYFYNSHPVSSISFEDCFLGIILAECARNQGNKTQFTLADFSGTLSFCLTRSVALGVREEAGEWIERQWARTKELISSPNESGDTASVLRIFRLARALDTFTLVASEEEQIILQCARDIAQSGEIGRDNWFRLTSWNPQLSRSLEIQKLPREGRIQLLRRTAELTWGERDPRAPFVIGYLGSAVAPGTFDHYRTVLEFEPKLRGVLLWYGFCAGLHRRNSLQLFSEGLGRRIAREFERPDSIYARPYCDVAVTELDVLMRTGKPLDLRLGAPGTIEIELAPCVTTTRSFATEEQTRRPENIDGMLRELDYKLQELSRLRSRIGRAIRPSEQQILYSDPSKAKRK